MIFQAKMPARPLRIPLSDLIILINCGSEHLTSLCLVSVTVAQTSQQKQTYLKPTTKSSFGRSIHNIFMGRSYYVCLYAPYLLLDNRNEALRHCQCQRLFGIYKYFVQFLLLYMYLHIWRFNLALNSDLMTDFTSHLLTISICCCVHLVSAYSAFIMLLIVDQAVERSHHKMLKV